MPNVEFALRRDFVFVGLYTLLLYGIVLFAGGPLTLHEGVLSQTTKVMLANHDWLVPRYGDAPWLERPPLPQWISCAICTVLGQCDQEWNVRLGSALAGLITVLLTVWLAGRLYGRVIGILSGLMLATMYNFLRYSTLAEADIYLAPIVAAALCVFAYTEILRTPLEQESRHFFGKRPWCVLLFFVLLGMTNLAKGLVFGTVITLAPVGVFLLWNLRWDSIVRYLWLWGWLVFIGIALPWPLLVVQRYPDAVDVWHFDLFGRLNSHYLEEPAWYYFACLLWVVQPWTFAAFIGMGLTFKKAFQEGAAADRFIWCWACMPLLVFSLSQGKHHHYMLHYLAPWAILAAQATVWIWQHYAVRWQKRWAVPIVLALVGDIALAFALRKPFAQCPSWSLPTLLSLFPVLVLSAWWLALHHRQHIGLIGGFTLVFTMYSMFFTYKGIYLHRSREDTAFLREVRRQIPLDQPLMINSAGEALEGLRMQFYIGDTTYFLHNLSFVLDDRVGTPDVFVVTRYNRMEELQKYGDVEPVLRCKHSRRESDKTMRWTLFRLHLRDDVVRQKANVRISPMQAMYRGEREEPYLDKR